MTILRKIFLLIGFVLAAFSLNAQAIIMGQHRLESLDDEVQYLFYDNGGANGEFAPNSRDTVTFESTAGNRVIYLTFSDFSIGYNDTLWIFDGASTNAPLLGAFRLVDNPTAVGSIQSASGTVTMVFHSDTVQEIGGLSDGWKAKLVLRNPDERQVLLTDQYTGDSYPIPVTSCNVAFYDDGGENGNMSSGTYTRRIHFMSDAGTYVKLEFDQASFNIGAASEMKIYDGNVFDATYRRLIGTFSNTNKPPTLFSSDPAGISVELIHSGAATAGFKATVTCVDEIFRPEGSACPEVKIYRNQGGQGGGQQLDVREITFSCDTPLIMLQADFTATGRYSNDYYIQSVPYNPPFPLNQGTSLGASVDDEWLNAVNLPFQFSYFGHTYNQVYPGSNGLISMSARTAGSYCSYTYSPPHSGTVNYRYTNSIYGVWEDIDPAYYRTINGMAGDIKYGVMGTWPCRTFVFNYLNVGLFGNHGTDDKYNTYQMVLYEGTNIIEVHIQHRNCCATTNNDPPNGNSEGMVGITNKSNNATTSYSGDSQDANQEVVVPGRGPTGWTVLGQSNPNAREAWRFVPITPLDEEAELTWYTNSIQEANIIGHTKLLPVSPIETTDYIAVYTFTNAAGEEFDLKDTVRILVNRPTASITNPQAGQICPGDSILLTANTSAPADNPVVSLKWSTGDTTVQTLVKPDVTTEYSVSMTFANGCTNSATTTVTIKPLDYPVITGDSAICLYESATLTANCANVASYSWRPGGETSNSITVTPQDSTTYTVVTTLNNACTTSSSFKVTVYPRPKAGFFADPTHVYVEDNMGWVQFNDRSTGASLWLWDFGDPTSDENTSMEQNPQHNYLRPGNFTIIQRVANEFGCGDETSSRVTVEVPFFFYVPNSFSPNGDEINDEFVVKGAGIDEETFRMDIFSRQGEMVLSTKSSLLPWNGCYSNGTKKCSPGMYVYVIKFNTLNGEAKEYTGTVTLVR